MEVWLDRAEGFSAWSSPVSLWLKEAPSTGGALDCFFLRLLAVFLQMTLLVTSVASPGFPSQGLASRGPASPGVQDHLELLPLNSWVCTTRHHRPEMTQPQKGYPLRLAGPLGVGQPGLQTLPPSSAKAVVLWKRGL